MGAVRMSKLATTLVLVCAMLVAAVVPTFMGIALLDYFAFERAKNQAQTVSKAVLKRAPTTC